MSKLAELLDKKHAIENNIDLSNAGKEKQLAALQKEVDNFRVSTTRELAAAWTGLKGKMKSNIEAVKSAEAEAAKQWDYARLNYMGQSVKSQIVNAANFQEVQALYNKAAASGDTHARRVWAELTRENIAQKYHTGEAVAFSKQLCKHLDDILSTPELAKAKAEGSELTKQAAALYRETEQTRDFYHARGNNAIFGIQTEFDKMLEGVRIAQKVDPETLATETLVTLED